jgi:hypothetical protein
MTKLKYIGRQEVPEGCDIDGRMWNIEGTADLHVKPFLHSTRTVDGLRELGIIPKIKLEVIA